MNQSTAEVGVKARPAPAFSWPVLSKPYFLSTGKLALLLQNLVEDPVSSHSLACVILTLLHEEKALY